MAPAPRIIPLHPAGPPGKGLSPMALDPADFASDLPRQNIHTYYENEALGISVGVWDTTTMQESFGPYPGDEFVVIQEGTFGMVDGADQRTSADAVAAIAIRNGAPVSWVQDGYLRKYFFIYLDPDVGTPELDSAEGGIAVIDPDGEMTVEDTNGVHVQRDHEGFRNDAGNLTCGVWDTTAVDGTMSPFPWHELAYILEGNVRITEPDGTVHHFAPGDAFYVPKGTMCKWDFPGYLKKYYAVLDTGD